MDLTLQLQLEEQALITACINQEKWAQKKLYEDNYPSMMALCMRYASNNDHALDILHESFIKVFRNIEKYQTGTSITAWIRKIVINTAIDFYRRNVKHRAEDISVADTYASGDPDVFSNLGSEEILNALQRLPPTYRSVFNLHVIEGYSHAEISAMLQVNESTCRSNLVKARLKLRQILLAAESDLND